MEKAALYVAGLTAAFWLGVLCDHLLAGCNSSQCLLRFLLR